MGDGHSHDWEACPKCVRLHARLPKFDDVRGILKEPSPPPDALRKLPEEMRRVGAQFEGAGLTHLHDWAELIEAALAQPPAPDVVPDRKVLERVDRAIRDGRIRSEGKEGEEAITQFLTEMATPPTLDAAGEVLAKAAEIGLVIAGHFDTSGTNSWLQKHEATIRQALKAYRKAHPKADDSEDRIEEICEQYLNDLQSADLPGPDRKAIVKEFAEFPGLDRRLAFVEMMYKARPKAEGM